MEVSLEKVVDGISKKLDNSESSASVSLSENGFTLTTKNSDLSTMLGLIFVIVLPPLGLLIYELNVESVLVILVWIAYFTYQFRKITLGDTKVRVDITCQEFELTKANVLFRSSVQPSSLNFLEVDKFEITSYGVSKYHRAYRLTALTTNLEEYIFADFNSESTAKYVRSILLKIVREKKSTTANNYYKNRA
ncbi:MAG: hypothetical protein K9J06_07765 [Flavobacteriales bacterium]|nr:hypothetical protein [Flavobacteriales bacterium]